MDPRLVDPSFGPSGTEGPAATVDGSVGVDVAVAEPPSAPAETESQVTSAQIAVPKPQLVPPLNFSLVEDGIYRSGFPMPLHRPFLEQLGLKTIIYLGDLGIEKKSKKEKKDKNGTAEIMAGYKEWINSTEIEFHHLPMESSQEPFISESEHDLARKSLKTALQLMLDKNNFPMLIHSNKGKHRIGVLVGLMRKIFQGWCMSGIFEEYEKFALGKSEYDLEFIELWQPEFFFDIENKPDFLRL